jgi:HemY protein
MIRASLTILVVAAAAVAALALTGDAGRASVVWLGWRADMTAAVAVLIVLFGALLTTVFWRTLLWILAAPQRAARARAETRRRQANDTLTRGFLAAAAGDGSEARRLAQKAADLADETPGLVRILAAQAAEAAGDIPAAQAAYTAMLGFPDMRLAGHKGLMQLALAQGERETALRHAQEAFSETRSARWAWRVLLEARLSAAEWSAGLELVKNAADRKIVPPVTAERARAALLAALAAQLSGSKEPKVRGQALDSAVEAAKLQPGFAPGVVMAARLLAEDGKLGRAAAVLENAVARLSRPEDQRDPGRARAPADRTGRPEPRPPREPHPRRRARPDRRRRRGRWPGHGRPGRRAGDRPDRGPAGARRLRLRPAGRGAPVAGPGDERPAGSGLVRPGPRGPRLRLPDR